MSPSRIRLVGDPVLAKAAEPVEDIDAGLVALSSEMLATMYEVPGIGLAAPQVGVSRRFFVYDIGEGPEVLVNPEIAESDGEWSFMEGCLSIPDMSFEIVRPKTVLLSGIDLDGNEVSIEADELLARLFQHELDHLDGVLMFDHLDDDQAARAKRELRERRLQEATVAPAGEGGLRLP